MNNALKLYYPQESTTLPILEAIKLLKTAPFGVQLSFIDPRTNTYIDEMFPFFYEPLDTYGFKGRCFISEWNGLSLYIPADISWFINAQSEDVYRKIFRQDMGYLSAGRFVTKSVKVEVSVNIRVGVEFGPVFHPLLSRSGHADLVLTETLPHHLGER